MKSLFNLSAAALALVLSFPAATIAQDVRDQDDEAKEECEQICQAFPSQAPPGCVCTLINPGGGGSSSPIDYENLMADELIQVVRNAEVERASGIQDYWTIEHSNITPLPTISYYERNPAGASTPFRLVPPKEVEQRQMKQTPMPAEDRATAEAVAADPGGALREMGAGIAIFGQALGGQLPIGGDALAGKSMDVMEGFMEAATDMDASMAEMSQAQDDQFQQLVDAVRPLFEGRPVLKGIYVPQAYLGSLGRLHYVNREAWESIYPEMGIGPDQRTYMVEDAWNQMTSTGAGGNVGLPCVVATYRGEAEVSGGADDGEVYTIEEAEVWIMAAVDPVPIYLRMVVRRGLQRLVVDRETTRWGWDQQKRLYYAGVIRQRIQGIAEALPEEHRRVEVGAVNKGVPSVEETARITSSAVGTPGADPTKP